MTLLGQTWPDGGGHRPGQKLPLSFAAVMLDNEDMKELVRTADYFHEDNTQGYSEKAGISLYGSNKGYDFELWERRYWETLISHVCSDVTVGYKSYSDPYGYIDGGPEPGNYYQFCCTSQPWKGSVLAVTLMSEMKQLWTKPDIFNYVERWVNFGTWSQPDPCAPCDGNPDNYGITYGPDPNNPGDCIKDNNPSDGIGRFPKLHNEEPDAGYRYSNFQKAMWEEYWTNSMQMPENPGDIVLFQNYPNPFSESTTIDYILFRNTEINISVYNIMGQKVRVLYSGHQQSGTYSEILIRENLKSGVYFYRIKTEYSDLIKKCVVIR